MTSWKVISNNVCERMIDDSLTHLFTERKTIRKRTKIFNREFRRLTRIFTYQEYTDIRKFSRKKVPDDDWVTDDNCLNNNDIEDDCELIESNYKNIFNRNGVCDIYTDSDEEELSEAENNQRILSPCLNNEDNNEQIDIENNEQIDNENNEQVDVENSVDCNSSFDNDINSPSKLENETNELTEGLDNTINNGSKMKNGESPKSKIKYSPKKELVKRNLDKDLTRVSIDNVDNKIAPGDSGIDDDSLDSLFTDANDVKRQKQSNEKLNKIITTPIKSQPKIMCTEIVTSKYKILCDDTTEYSEKININEKSCDENIKVTCDEVSTDNKTSENNETQKTYVSSNAPTEAESLQYILRNIHIRNQYNNNNNHSFLANYFEDKKETNEPEIGAINNILMARPMDLDDLVEEDNLLEMDAVSTLAFDDITEDDEIILIEIPKLIIDNHELRGKRMRIKKRSVIIGDTRYAADRKQNDSLSCLMKVQEDNNYKLETVQPRASIIIRQNIVQEEPDSPKSIYNIGKTKKQYAPFPKNLKRRNPLVLQSNCKHNI